MGIADQDGESSGNRSIGRAVALSRRVIFRASLSTTSVIAGLELHQRLFALLDHFLENAQHWIVESESSLVDLALLDGRRIMRINPSRSFSRAHRRLHVIRNAFFERHPYADNP